MIFFGERSLRNAVNEFIVHYHTERNHQGLGNEIIDPGEEVGGSTGDIECRERLGGMLRNYHRKAASPVGSIRMWHSRFARSPSSLAHGTANPRPGGPATAEIQPVARLEKQITKELRHGPIYLTPRHPLYAIYGQDPREKASKELGEKLVAEIVRRLAGQVDEALNRVSSQTTP